MNVIDQFGNLKMIGNSGLSGQSGWSGTSGTSGTSGWSGIAGVVGASGFSGTSGRSGFSGTSGSSGYSGAVPLSTPIGVALTSDYALTTSSAAVTGLVSPALVSGGTYVYEIHFILDIVPTGNSVSYGGLDGGSLTVSSLTNAMVGFGAGSVGTPSSNNLWGTTMQYPTFSTLAGASLVLTSENGLSASHCIMKGSFVASNNGTFQPKIHVSTLTGGTPNVKTGSYMTLVRIS